MRIQSMLALLALATAAMSGCIEGTDAPADTDSTPTASGLIPNAPDISKFLGTVENDHATGDAGHVGHQLAELHAHEFNLQLADYNDLSEGLVGPGSGYIEVHVAGDLAVVASILGSRGASLVDVSDPENMEVLSHVYNMDDNWDSRLSEDGRYLFVGCQGSGAFDCTTIKTEGEGQGLEGGTACTSYLASQSPVKCPGGVAIFDLIEPRAPIYIDYLPMGNTHNVFSFQHDNGNYYVLNEDVTIAEWNPEARTFQIVSQGDMPGTHDVDIQKHPITGDWLAYTGTDNMAIWNLNDPGNPVLVSVVGDEGLNADAPPLWHEQTPMPCLIDGRHITLGAGESGAGLVDAVGVIDTTDPAVPIYLGQWKLPDADSLTGQRMYRFSVHNIDGNCDGQVAVGHYHAGVWVFDISTFERMKEPATLAYYMPHERSITTAWSPVTGAPIGAVVTADQPNVWAAQWSDDGQTLFVPDMTSGLYALTPTWTHMEA